MKYHELQLNDIYRRGDIAVITSPKGIYLSLKIGTLCMDISRNKITINTSVFSWMREGFTSHIDVLSVRKIPKPNDGV